MHVSFNYGNVSFEWGGGAPKKMTVCEGGHEKK